MFDATINDPTRRTSFDIATISATRLLNPDTCYSVDKLITKLVKSYPITPSLIYDNLKHGPTNPIKFSLFAGYSFYPNIGLRVQAEHMRCHWRHSERQSKQSIAIANNHVMSSGQHYLSIRFNNFSKRLEGVQFGVMLKVDENKWNETLSGREMIEPFTIKMCRIQPLGNACNIPEGAPDHPHCIHYEVEQRANENMLKRTYITFGPLGRQWHVDTEPIEIPTVKIGEIGMLIDMTNGSVDFFIDGVRRNRAKQTFAIRGPLVPFVQTDNKCPMDSEPGKYLTMTTFE